MKNIDVVKKNIPSGMSATEIFMHKFVMGSSASAGVKTIILDPEEEYKDLSESLKSKKI